MSSNKVKKVKMATKSCPECDQQIPVACKSCHCGYVFISRKLLNAKLNETSPVMDNLDAKRRRTERIRKEKINLTSTSDMENRRRPHSSSQSDPIRRGRGRPKTVGLKKQEEEKASGRERRYETILAACDGVDCVLESRYCKLSQAATKTYLPLLTSN
uniref:Chromosome 16 open reading frame 87 n=1 Tax=Cyprinus carpio carpio TaxID=630221 RepID=A0A9J8B436_CYPCA